MFHDILEKMCEVEYFKIFFSSELTHTVAIDFKLVFLLFKVCPSYHAHDFFFFFGVSFLILTLFFFLQPVYSLFFLKQSISIVFFCFYFRSFSPSYLIEAMSSRIVFKMSALIDVVFSYCFPFDNLFTFSLSYFYIGHHFTFFSICSTLSQPWYGQCHVYNGMTPVFLPSTSC